MERQTKIALLAVGAALLTGAVIGIGAVVLFNFYWSWF